MRVVRPVPESIIEELRSMNATDPIVVAGNGETLDAEDTLAVIAVAQRPGPDLQVGDLIRAGLNGFAFEMLVESVRQFRDFETFGPFRFSLRGVSITLAYDAESDAGHKARRSAQRLPEQDPHWEKRRDVALADVGAREPLPDEVLESTALEQALLWYAPAIRPEDVLHVGLTSVVHGVLGAASPMLTVDVEIAIECGDDVAALGVAHMQINRWAGFVGGGNYGPVPRR